MATTSTPAHILVEPLESIPTVEIAFKGRVGRRTHGRRSPFQNWQFIELKRKRTGTMNGGLTAVIGISTKKGLTATVSRMGLFSKSSSKSDSV